MVRQGGEAGARRGEGGHGRDRRRETGVLVRAEESKRYKRRGRM